jgi:Cu/Ag efflux protein CusF
MFSPRSLLIAAVFVSISVPVSAQPTDRPGGIVGTITTATATVSAIDPKTRMITLTRSDGASAMLTAGPEVKNFAQIKKGDKVVVEQVESMAIVVTPPGEVAPGASETATLQTAKPGEKPHGVLVRTRQLTATVQAIDYKARTVTLKGPEGNTQTLVVGPEAKRFNQVKKGDQVTVNYTEATAISVRKP